MYINSCSINEMNSELHCLHMNSSPASKINSGSFKKFNYLLQIPMLERG